MDYGRKKLNPNPPYSYNITYGESSDQAFTVALQVGTWTIGIKRFSDGSFKSSGISKLGT